MKVKYSLQNIEDIYYIYMKIDNRDWVEIYSTSNQSEALIVLMNLNNV